MKILIVTPHYIPGYKAGGPIQSVYNLSKLLGNIFEIYILTKNNDLGNSEKYNIEVNAWLSLQNHQVKYIDDSNFKLAEIKKAVDDVIPDLIYFNSLFNNSTWKFCVYNFFIKTNIKIVIAPRGELDRGALSIRSFKKKCFLPVFKTIIRSNIVFHATTVEEKVNISNIFNSRSYVAENVPNIISVKPLRSFKASSITNFVFISRIAPKKNLLYCLEIFSQMDFVGEINFDIIGPIEDQDYWKKVGLKIDNLANKININYIGEVPNSKLLELTKNYHYFFFPTLAENYGHIIYEALSYGMPVILSNNTPWKENNNGVYVRNLENVKGFVDVLLNLHNLDNKEYQLISDLAFDFVKNKINVDELVNSYKILFDATN